MNDDATIRDLLDAAGHLPDDADLDSVRAWLGNIRDGLNGAGRERRALAREAVVSRLQDVDTVSAPARLADGFLDGDAPTRTSTVHGSAMALENPNSWPEPVDGADVLKELHLTFGRFLALPEGAATAVALWTMHAHSHDASPVSPVLALTSPEKRCGKTTALELLSVLVPRPLPASNVTAATVFRAVERWEPTLLVDEADTFIHDGSELRGILNSGHRRSLAYVIRTVGDDHEARTFRTWSPKAIALIGELPDTLADRSIEIRMRRRAPDEEVERLRLDRLEREFEPLRRKAWTWAQGHLKQLQDTDPSMPAGLHDRERDNWRPLLSVADVAGGGWPDQSREAAKVLRGHERDDRSRGTRLLADIRGILQAHSSDRIRSKELVKRLCDLEEAPWSEYKGRGLSPVSLANFLKSFDVSSKQLRFPSGSYKGYERDAFKDVFRRYLPTPSKGDPPKAKQAKQSRSDKESDGFSTENIEDDVSPSKCSQCPDTTGNVSGVSTSQGKESKGDPPNLEAF